MQNSLKKMLARMFADKKRQRRIVAVVCVLSVLVTTTVFTELMQPVITMTPDPVCGQAEHAHGADCFANQLSCDIEESEEHAHGDDCYKNVLVCSKSEHAHTEKCYPKTVEEKKVTVAEPTEVPFTEAPAVMSISEAESTEAPATEAPATEAPVIASENEVTAEPTVEATVEPTAEVTVEPAPTVAVTAVSAEKVFVGQTVIWTIDAANETELTYYIADETGAEIASGALDADASYISWLADRAGAFTLTVTATNETGSVSANGSVTVEASEDLVAAVRADALSCFAGEEITFHFAYSGGVEPASVRIAVDQDGQVLTELAEFAETVTVTPANVSEVVTTVTAEITVTDSVGNTATGVCEIPCAVRTRETGSDWEKSTRVELTGEWPEDLISVAETQLGYEESEINFIVDDEGERQGYTRYGQWYGSSYAEWCAMFVSFDLNYAEIPEKYFPREANCEKWISALKSCGLYESAEGDYEPEVGDLVFFDWEDNNESDHVGIITAVTDKKIETIEGNADKGVRRRDYDRDDEVLYGYGCVLEAYETYLRDELDLDLEAGVGAQAIVTAETANLRAEADADSELVGQLAIDIVVDVLAAEQNRAEIWYQVAAGEQTGWIRSDLVEINYVAEEEQPPVAADSNVGIMMLAVEEAEIEGLVPNEYYASTSSMSNNENYAVEASVVFVPVDSEGNELTDVEAPATARTMLNYTGSGYRKEFKNTEICPEVDQYVGAENVYSVSLRITTDGVETEVPANYVSIFSRWNATPFTGCYFTYGEAYGNCVNYLYNPNAYFVVRYIFSELQNYTATFVNGDAIVEKRTFNIGEALGELPEAPAAEDGSIFLGWATINADGEKVFATEETVIAADTAFEAVYAASATVEFVYLDPETNALTDLCEDQTVAVGTVLTFPTQESFIENSYPENLNFVGWQILNGETFEAVAEPYTVAGNTVFYGVFQMPVTVTFQYTVEGDGIEETVDLVTYRVPTSGATLAETIAANTGVDVGEAQLPECPLTSDTQYFSHWEAADGTVATLETPITADTIFEAEFADKALVRFQYSLYSGELQKDVTQTVAECYAIPGELLSTALSALPTVEIPGRRFGGWIETFADGTYVDVDLNTVVAEDATEVVYTAVLNTEISINFVYQDVMDSDQDGNVDETITVASYAMLPEEKVANAYRTIVVDGVETREYLTEIPAAPIFENYKFTGWYYTGDDGLATLLEDLAVFNYALESINVTGGYDDNPAYSITLHDMDPDGNEKLPEGVESIDVLVSDGEALTGYLPEVSLADRTADEVIKWYTLDADGVKTEYDPTQPVESDLELYTYTYRIVLTLADSAEAEQTASLLDFLMPKAYAATVTVNGNTLTIEIADGETLKASDFVIDGVDYSLYSWTDAAGNLVDLYVDLIGNTEISGNITLTTTTDTKISVSDTNTAVKFYVSINGEWKLVTTMSDIDLYELQGGETTGDYVYSHSVKSGRWTYYYYYRDTVTSNNEFISQSLLESVYGQYGYVLGESNVAGNFPYSSNDDGTVTSNNVVSVETAKFSTVAEYSGSGSRAWYRGTSQSTANLSSTTTPSGYSNTVDAESAPSTVAIYYTPNSTVTDGSKATAYATSDTFWSVTVTDNSNLVYGVDEILPATQYVLTGNTATVTLKTPVTDENGITPVWSATNATLTKVQDNADGTTTYTVSDMTGAVTISTSIPGSYTIIYQIPNDSSELEQVDNYGGNYGAAGQTWISLPNIQEADEYSDVVVLGEDEEYIVLEPDSSTAKSRYITEDKEHTNPSNVPIYTNDYFHATYTFVAWKVDDDKTVTVNALDGLTEAELKALDKDGDGIITLTPDWSLNPDGRDDVITWNDTKDHRAYDTCSFWVVLSTSIQDSMETTDTKANYYSDCLYTTDVDNPNDISSDPLIAASTTDEQTDAAANARIRRLATDPYNGVSLGNFPSDATILANLVDWLTREGNEDAAVYVDGVAVDPATLTTDNYTIRWYVFKYQGDGWHIDGKLIPRNGMIRVTKSFYGNATAIAEAKDNVSITATETGNTSTSYALDLKNQYDATDYPYGYVEYDKDTQTYTWLLTVKKDTQYTIKESGYTVGNVTENDTAISIATLAEYMTTDEGQWHTYDDSGVTVTAESYWADTAAGQVDAVNLMNSYIPTNTMILRKVDGNSGQPVGTAVSFVLKKKGDDGNYSVFEDLWYAFATDTYYLYNPTTSGITATQVESGTVTVGASGSVVIVGLKEVGTGDFAFDEITPPTGYNRIDPVKFTITTTYDDAGNAESKITVSNDSAEYAEATNDYTLRIKNFPMTSKVIAKKVWPDGEEKLPVTFQLYRNGVSMGSSYVVELDGTKDSVEKEAWTCEWENLPLYLDGAVADYEIIETWIGTAGESGSTSYDPSADTDGYENYVVTKADVVYTFNSDGSTSSSPVNGDEYANIATLVVTNRKETGKITFSKVDPSGNPVADATFTLYRVGENDTLGAVQATATSTATGAVEFPMVPSGTYYLMKETGTPEGYCEDATVYKVVITGTRPVIYAPSTGENSTTVYTTEVTSIINVPSSMDLTIKKVSEDADGNEIALEGATFQIKLNDQPYLVNGGESSTFSPAKANSENGDAIFTITDIESSDYTYTITESAAPAGYYGMTGEIKFKVTNGVISDVTYPENTVAWDKGTNTFTVANVAGKELPSTGGPGTLTYTIGGLLLMAASLLYGIGQRRKRERGQRDRKAS